MVDTLKAARISWGRMVVAGVLAEVILFVIVFSVLCVFNRRAFLIAIVVGSAILPFLFSLWVGKRIHSNFVLQGALVGVVAVLFYVIVSRARPEPTLYVISHGLKILGGMAGGLTAAIRKRLVTSVPQPQ